MALQTGLHVSCNVDFDILVTCRALHVGEELQKITVRPRRSAQPIPWAGLARLVTKKVPPQPHCSGTALQWHYSVMPQSAPFALFRILRAKIVTGIKLHVPLNSPIVFQWERLKLILHWSTLSDGKYDDNIA